MNEFDIKNFENKILGAKTPLLKNAEQKRSIFRQDSCPYNLCDGKGYIRIEQDGFFSVQHCRCYDDFVLRQKLRNSNIQERFLNAQLNLENIKATLLKPKIKPDRPQTKKVKNKEMLESPEEYIERVYQPSVQKDVNSFARKWKTLALNLLDKKPRTASANLMLMGDPDVGKTHLACAIAREFKKEDKSVFFISMSNLIAAVISDKEIQKKIESTDLLIIDELGREFHSDSKWADGQMHEFFRLRYNSCLPTICTTNFSPDEIARFYDKALLSTFHTYFYLMLESESNNRIHELEHLLDVFNSMEEDSE